jgi:two-component system sensor kinase FixL
MMNILPAISGRVHPHIIGTGRDVKGLKKDGTLFPFRLAVSEVKYSGRTIYTGFIHDLSREKEAEAQILHYASQLEKLVEDRTNSLQKSVIRTSGGQRNGK